MLDKIIGVDEASKLWDLSPGYIKNLCAHGKLECKKIGKTWIILKDQPNPKNKTNTK
ncbi:helix-turn-helix domain-containing protein [Bacillus inaquosorum]|uniref:helix-turn-helix domain-containing protein n=1 Tax=Bacillus inaquosorum TaxID=483913 RepID=UPI002281D5CD|nr:helix-turn-helix domain-containing protein [Bacillus inaquosorum]MCY9066618.1 helix-turn-helix domain-containing protein [Bacillus inaquosorum]